MPKSSGKFFPDYSTARDIIFRQDSKNKRKQHKYNSRHGQC